MESTPRINSARLGDFVGRDIRIVGKLKHLTKENSAIIETSDGGQVEIKHVTPGSKLSDTYVEVVGNVLDTGTIKYKAGWSWGEEVDLKVVNDSIEMMHDPKFKNAFF